MKRFCLWLALLSVFSFAREVPVRYLTMDDSLEREAIFVKLVKDTVYLREYTPEEIAAKQAKALAEAEEQAIIEKYGDIEDSSSVNSTTEEASESVEPSEEEATVPEEAVSQEPAADDFEAALLVTDSLKEAKADSSATDSLKVDSLKTDSVQAVEAPKDVYIRLFKYDFKRLINVESGEMVDLTLSDYEYTEEEEEEEYIPLYPEGKANLLVKSIPEACSLFVNGVPLEMLTPDTIKNIKPGKYNISIKKRLKDVDWWGNKAVKINDDSLNVIEVEVERPSTRLTVNTVPEAVEVYLDESPNENVMPHYMSDVVIEDIKPSTEMMVYFRKVGYLDTAIITEVQAFMPNTILVELEPVTMNLGIIDMQKEYNRERTSRFIGRGLLWSSIVPFVSAGVLWYLAEQDWKEAKDKKDAYESGSAFYNEDTRKLV
ncbi:MAG TPA: hypothetical protein PK366_06035, partial [Fibrobacteraceae bacterium]|nr:hypothetical protein [Fibrobacteraceae bacterium]